MLTFEHSGLGDSRELNDLSVRKYLADCLPLKRTLVITSSPPGHQDNLE